MKRINMKEIAKQTFAYCPHCKSKMLYFIKNIQCAIPSEDGRYKTSIINEKNDIVAYCPRCESKYNMVNTIEGITTKEYSKNKLIIEKENIIGYIEGEQEYENQ